MNPLPKLRRLHWFEWLPYIAVGLGPVALLLPDLLCGRALFWGTPLLQFVPWRTYAFELLRAGEAPLWNDLLGMGAPLLANYQSALLYPPTMLLLLTGPALGNGLLVMLHLIWTGVGCVLLTRRLGLGSLGQSVAGAAFSLCGYLVARGGFLSIIATAAWLPWLILAVERLAGAQRRSGWGRETAKSIAVLGFVFAMQWLAGHAQTAWYSLLLAFVWGVWRGFSDEGKAGAGRIALALGAGGLSGLALAAVQLFPTLEYLSQSQRVGTLEESFALTYSFWPWRLLTLLAPNLFGNPAGAGYWGYGNYWEDAVYVGVLPFLLACRAVLQGLRGAGARARLIRFLAGAGLVAFAFALGKNTPIFVFLFRHLPTFGLFQAPTRWNLITVFALSLLAGIGAEGWERPSERGKYWTRLGMAGAAIVGVAAWAASQVWPDIETSFVSAFARMGVWLFLFGAVHLLQPASSGARWWAFCVSTLVVVDLVLLGAGLNPTIDAGVFGGESHLLEKVGREHRTYMPPEVEYDAKFVQTHRFDRFLENFDWSYVRDIGLPNTTLLDRIPSANNFDPLLPARYAEWMEQLEELPETRKAELLGLMDVGWVALDDGGIRYRPVPNPSRVRVLSQARFVDSTASALTILADEGFDPQREIVLEGKPAIDDATQAGTGSAVIEPTRGSTEVRIRASTSGGGWLQLSDSWYPGWKVYVDDRPNRLYRSDGLFRAVWVPDGDHSVRFRYQPLSFTLGSWLSLLAWMALLGLLWRWRPK